MGVNRSGDSGGPVGGKHRPRAITRVLMHSTEKGGQNGKFNITIIIVLIIINYNIRPITRVVVVVVVVLVLNILL